jgi:hypothetical protein
MKLRRIKYYRTDKYGDLYAGEDAFDARENVVPRVGERVLLHSITFQLEVYKVVYDQFHQTVEIYLQEPR